MASQDFPKDFAGTEYYRERVEERTLVDGGCVLTSVAHHRINPADYREDVLALCDHIDWQQCHIKALDIALRESGGRRAAVEKKVEELEDYINRAIKQLYDGLDMFDHDMRFYAENAIEILGKAAEEEVSKASPERSLRTESSEEKP